MRLKGRENKGTCVNNMKLTLNVVVNERRPNLGNQVAEHFNFSSVSGGVYSGNLSLHSTRGEKARQPDCVKWLVVLAGMKGLLFGSPSGRNWLG